MSSKTEIRMALPSKGRMEGETIEFLADCGLKVNKTNPRQYSARIPALPDVLVLFQRVRDIPKSIAAGDIDLGIGGYDTVYETLGDDQSSIIMIHEAMEYGGCELVVAVPGEWTDVTDMASLGDYARRIGGLRVATKHTNSAELFLKKHGISESIRVVSADGALEAAPTVGYADFIIDISSTGTTLRENNLKALADGTIVTSEACFFGNRAALQQRPEVLSTAVHLLEFIEAHLRASGQYLLFANMRGETAEEIAARIYEKTELGGLQGPTISPIVGAQGHKGWWAINIVASAERLYETVKQLREIGGSGVVVTPATYIFEEQPERQLRLQEEIRQGAAR